MIVIWSMSKHKNAIK